MTKGLPGSGKSTWAKETVKHFPGKYKRINKDDLRNMLDDGKHSKGNENFVLAGRNALVLEAFGLGYSVIIDDTNFAPKHEEALRLLAAHNGAIFEIKDFTDVPVEECIRRDNGRTVGHVGAGVIWDMYRTYLKKEVPAYPYDPFLPDIILSDLDGTLVKMGDRNPYDASNCDLVDTLNKHVSDAVYALSNFHKADVFFMSGREKKDFDPTVRFLTNNSWEYYTLIMRETGDTRPDEVVKLELFNQRIRGKYNVLAVFDDRPKVVRLWKSLGLPVFNCGDSEEF